MSDGAGFLPFELIAMGRIGVDLYPEQAGSLTDVRTFAKSLGGSPTNVAVAAARLGHRVALVSGVGSDRLGTYCLAALERFGVDTRFVARHPVLKTPIVIAELDPPEDPGLEFYREPSAPDMQVEADDLDLGAIAAATVFWATGTGLSAEPSREATLAALRARAGSGADGARAGTAPDAAAATRHTVLDLDWRPMFWTSEDAGRAAYADALECATIVVGNRDEVRVAVGSDEPREAARRILGRGAQVAIVKLGADGVLVATDAGEVDVVEPCRVEVVCGLGAGDAFGGALCHGLLSGLAPADAVRLGNAAGAFVAARLACADAMPTRAELDAMLKEHAHAR